MKRFSISSLRRLRGEDEGTALIEFAIAFPVLIVFILVGMELTNYILVKTQVNRIAVMSADSASRLRTPMTESFVNQIFTGVQKSGDWIDFSQKGRVIISSVQQNADSSGEWIRWQRCHGALGVSSKYGREGSGRSDSSIQSINGLKSLPGSAIVFSEVTYDYQPIFPNHFMAQKRIKHDTAYVVRQRTDYSISGTNPAAC